MIFKRYKFAYLLVAFYCFLGLTINAQEPAYRQYAVNDGLPSSQVYQSIQDNRGFMWFGTDRGLVRFDGYEFKTYTTKDGLCGDVIFGFHKDHNDRIWMYSFHSGISYLKGDSIITPHFNDTLKSLFHGIVIGSMHVDLNDTIRLAAKVGAVIIKISPNGKISKEKLTSKGNTFITQIDSSGCIFGVNSKRKNSDFSVGYTLSGIEYPFNVPYFKASSSVGKGLSVVQSKNKFYCSISNSIFSIVDSTFLQSSLMDGEVTMSLYEDSKGNIWNGMYKEGANRFAKGNLNNEPRRFLKGYTVTSIYEDQEGGFWFTTIDAGIFYTSDLTIYSKEIKLTNRSEPITAIDAKDSSIWIATKFGRIFNYQPDKRSFHLIQDIQKEIYYLRKTKNWLIIGSGYGKVYSIDTGYKNIILPSKAISTDQNNLNSDSVWTLLYHDNQVIENDEYYRPIDLIYNSTYVDSLHDPTIITKIMHRWKGNNYIGTYNGLVKVNDLKNHQFSKWELPFNFDVLDISSSDKHLFIATKKHGIIVLNENTFWNITDKNGLPTNHMEAITIENDSVLWAGSKKGLSKIQIHHRLKQVAINNNNSVAGLISNEISVLSFKDGILWVGTNNGLSYFKTDEYLFNSQAPPIYITSVLVNDIESKGEKEFSHQSTVFDFSFVGLDYRGANKLTYKYRLKGFDDSWNVTTSREVSYMLPSGEYTFEVLAKNNDGVWSITAAEYSFTVLTPFWQQGWFIVFSIILIVAWIVLYYNKRINRLKLRAAQEVKMAQSQHQALSAQLQPHFVFNALNSINNYIRKNDKESSSEYLSLFSQLIRQILNNSNQPLVTVQQELKLVEKYLQLEQLRFKEKMTYSIFVDKKIDSESVKIPTQLIQPYVENAIWHGIMNKKEPGHIQLNLSLDKEQLVCEIEDNGIGRAASLSLKSKKGSEKHKSFGMNINSERLALVEAMFKRPVGIKVDDLVDKEGKVSGTKVSLSLPIIKTQSGKV